VDGTADLSIINLCSIRRDQLLLSKSSNPNYCPFIKQTQSNRLVIEVKDGDAIKIAADLIDYDELSGDDAVCITSFWTEKRSLQEWAQTINENLTLSVHHSGYATCNVSAVMNAISK
jgi:hypothetical protein